MRKGDLVTVSEGGGEGAHRRPAHDERGRRQRPGACARSGAAQEIWAGISPISSGLELVDFKVRILTGGTDAVTRVLIESHDRETGRRWFTVGVSPNIVDASFEALIDSIDVQAVIKDGAAPAPEPPRPRVVSQSEN